MDLDVGFGTFVDDFEGVVLGVALDILVVEFTADESFCEGRRSKAKRSGAEQTEVEVGWVEWDSGRI